MIFVPARVRIEKDTVVRIHRFLKGQGKFLVQVGQEVAPDEIIGRSEFSGGFVKLNLAELLGVSGNEVGKYLKRQLGSRIYKDELLAQKNKSLFNKEKVITCPADGILDYVNQKSGEIRITRLPENVDLPAGVYGIIEHINNQTGQTVIKTQATRVHGVCGSGRIRDGILSIVTKKDSLISKSIVSPKYDGHILVNGSIVSKETILAAISSGISGIITGGINAPDYKSIAGGRIIFPKKLENDIGVSILVCEGFGSIPIGDDIYETLVSYEGKFVTIDGNHAIINLPSFASNSMIKIKKTHLPPNFDESSNDIELIELHVGQKARVIGSSFTSEQGKVLAIDKTQTVLPSKISSFVVTLETKRRKIQIPSTNLEVIA